MHSQKEKGRRILLVDDEPDLVCSTSSTLLGTFLYSCVNILDMWLSRKKKPIFIPDPPITVQVSSKMTAVENNDNGNDNTNNNGDDDEMKLEPKSAAFVSNQPSRLSPPQQEQEQHREQRQDITPTATYPYSIKIEQDPKGSVKISIHVYSQDLESASDQVVKAFLDTREKFKEKGVKVLEA